MHALLTESAVFKASQFAFCLPLVTSKRSNLRECFHLLIMFESSAAILNHHPPIIARYFINMSRNRVLNVGQEMVLVFGGESLVWECLHPITVISVRSNVCVRPEDGYNMSRNLSPM
jgi:hypothetical protein